MAQCHQSKAMFPGLRNGQFHGPAAYDLSESVIAFDGQQWTGVLQNPDFGVWAEVPALEPLDILRDPDYAMGIMADEICAGERLGDYSGLVFRDAIGRENGDA